VEFPKVPGSQYLAKELHLEWSTEEKVFEEHGVHWRKFEYPKVPISQSLVMFTQSSWLKVEKVETLQEIHFNRFWDGIWPSPHFWHCIVFGFA